MKVSLENYGENDIVHTFNGDAGVTQLARVPAFQADCCGFEPRHPLHWNKEGGLRCFFFLFEKWENIFITKIHLYWEKRAELNFMALFLFYWIH